MQEYQQHCLVIDHTDWSGQEKRNIKRQLKKFLKEGKPFPYEQFPIEYRWNFCSARLRDQEFSNWDGWEFRSDWAMTFRWGQDIQSPIPKWDGGPSSHLVVLGEQGIGDEILFSSALPELMVRVGTKNIEFQSYPKLKSIIERSFGVKCTDRKPLSEVKEGQHIVALGDLFPWYRRHKSHFPKKPYLKPDPEKVSHWSEWLKQFNGPKIGVAWYSRHGFLNPDDLITEGTYFDLQYRSEVDMGGSKDLIPVPFDTRDDFDNLFAFVACLDEVRTVTQTLSHVCGSQGKTCKAVIPPKNGEVNWYLWYYFDGKSYWDSPIYPNFTIYKSIDEFRAGCIR